MMNESNIDTNSKIKCHVFIKIYKQYIVRKEHEYV